MWAESRWVCKSFRETYNQLQALCPQDNQLLISRSWSELACFSYFLLLPCSFQSWRWCHRSLPFVSLLAAFLLWVPSLHSKDQRLSFFIWSPKRWGETISSSYLIQQLPLCFGWEAFRTVNQLLFSDFLLSYSRQWLLFYFFSCDLSWNINLHFLILKRFSLGCRFSKLLSFLIECTMLTLGCRDCRSRLASWGAWEAQSMSPWFSTATFCQCFSLWFRCGFSHMVWLENRAFLSVGFHRWYRPQTKCQASITGALRMWWFVTCYITHWNCTK